MKKIFLYILVGLSFISISYGDWSSDIWEDATDAYNAGQYEKSIDYWKLYLEYYPTDEGAKNNLYIVASEYGWSAFQKQDWENAIKAYRIVYDIDSASYAINYLLGLSYENNRDFGLALVHYREAFRYAEDEVDFKSQEIRMKNAQKGLEIEEGKKTPPSKDPFSYLQYYLKDLNIPSAWGKVTNSNEVVVAIIDEGIYLSHPDIDKIWVNPNAAYGDSKNIDFFGGGASSDIISGQHGTMVAGIIGAIQNNNEGIAGIAKNVSFMSLRVFDSRGETEEDNIIDAMNYAIKNGANIINLSLGNKVAFSKRFDPVIKNAYDKGIIVVIAAGNGDIYTKNEETGLDLNKEPISPICNNGGNGNKYSIGVYASDFIGYRTNWTNYGIGCARFMAPGVDILSAAIPKYSVDKSYYDSNDGTSFSAPIITGVIALGYNQYGYVSPDIVYDSLVESLTKNQIGNDVIDASKYLDILKKKSKTIQAAQQTRIEAVNTTSDADVLADFGIITKKETVAEYRLDNNVLRQEVIGMAMKLAGITPPTEYTCKNTFRDVSAVKPNNWVCRAVEIGVENGIVSGANKNFNPESNITRAEALAILMKAAGIKIQEGSNSKYADVTVPWQINIVNTAFSYSFIDAADSFYPNKNATRGEIFNMAKRILKSKS